MIIAELAIFPTSEGSSVSRFVKQAVLIIEASGLTSETGGMSTTIQAPDLGTLFNLIEEVHQAILKMGAQRIHIDLRVDHRLDKDATISSKKQAVGKK